MIKIALKHYIFELCINTLFDTFKNNVILPSTKKNIHDKFFVGEEFYEIGINPHKNTTLHLYNCEIKHVRNWGFHVTYGIMEKYVNNEPYPTNFAGGMRSIFYSEIIGYKKTQNIIKT